MLTACYILGKTLNWYKFPIHMGTSAMCITWTKQFHLLESILSK